MNPDFWKWYELGYKDAIEDAKYTALAWVMVVAITLGAAVVVGVLLV